MAYDWSTQSWNLSTEDEHDPEGAHPEGDFVAYLSVNQVPETGGIGLVVDYAIGGELGEEDAYYFLVRQSVLDERENETALMSSQLPVTLRMDSADGFLHLFYSYDEHEWIPTGPEEIPISDVTQVGAVLRADDNNLLAQGVVSYFVVHPGAYANEINETEISEPEPPPSGPDWSMRRTAQRFGTSEDPDVTGLPTLHGLLGAQFGDLEFDIGRSARWFGHFVDDLYITDINTGEQRYWVVNWTGSFPDAHHLVTGTNFFVLPAVFRKEQFDAGDALFDYDDDDWVVFIDGHEGYSVDNRSLPDDYTVAPFKSFVWRETTRAILAGRDRVYLPFFVFLRSAGVQNITYDTGLTITDPEDPAYVPPVSQAMSVPYYLAHKSLPRIWKVSTLRAPGFDWSLLDVPADAPVGDPSYLNGTSTQFASTPDSADFIILSDTVFTAKVMLTAVNSAGPNFLWCQRTGSTTGVNAYMFTQNGLLYMRASINGTANIIPSALGSLIGKAVDGVPFYIKVTIDVDNGAGGWTTTGQFSTDGVTWVNLTSPAPQTVATVLTSTFDSPAALQIGHDLAASPGTWPGRIYWIECRTGLVPGAGTLKWKFDPNLHTTGTTWSDGVRTWTTIAPAIVHPGDPLGVKAQLISYGYAHWNIQDIVPPATDVAPLDSSNDLGWKMRNLLSMVRPIPGLPIGSWVSPASDPAGVPGPWSVSARSATNPDFTVDEDVGHVGTDASTAAIRVPLYDTVFRINLRDGLWYEVGDSGNIPLYWVTDHWESRFNPVEWETMGVMAGPVEE